MKSIKISLVFWAFLALMPIQVSSQQPDDLVGYWEGTPPNGGTLQMTIQKVANGEISGYGIVKYGGKTVGKPNISGKIFNSKVMMVTTFPQSGAVVTYDCVFKEIDYLECVTTPDSPKPGFETSFKKMK